VYWDFFRVFLIPVLETVFSFQTQRVEGGKRPQVEGGIREVGYNESKRR